MQEINNLIAAANAGQVDVAIVGSEAILNGYVTVSQLIAYMNQVRQAIPANVLVTTADTGGTFLSNPSLISASDIIFANLYPYWVAPRLAPRCALWGSSISNWWPRPDRKR